MKVSTKSYIALAVLFIHYPVFGGTFTSWNGCTMQEDVVAG